MKVGIGLRGYRTAVGSLSVRMSSNDAPPDVTARIRPGRKIAGMSAVLVPYTSDGDIDWGALEAHIDRTADAGLVPAVNMDTGYVQLLADADRLRVLDLAAKVTDGDFVAGAYVADQTGTPFDLDAYLDAAAQVAERGGTPVVFPSHGLNALDGAAWVDAHAAIGNRIDRFIGFELGPMFVPHGRIYPLDAYRGLLEIAQCIGAKHSSLDRRAEWDRLALRDQVRPDFRVLTGNDLAIDMVMYGSDYLLGLSTFAPDVFAERDAMWERGDSRFHERNDLLQYLGQFAFRRPVPAYRHDAAMFLELRGWATSDVTPPGVPRRPDSDRDVLADIADRLGVT
jgi:dihydrodipicolinate synthase/N-acetylneuraminate lyase